MLHLLNFTFNNLRPLAQFGSPLDPSPGAAAPGFELPIGAVIVGFIVSIGIQVLFGMWGKSKAEEQNVHPLTGFMLGFFLAWIGVKMVPLFKAHRIINTNRRPQTQAPIHSAPNPIYTAGTAMSRSAPPPGPPQPMPPQQQPSEMLVADEAGYVVCPHCGARAKAGRKACMSCGNMLPPVFDPNAQQ